MKQTIFTFDQLDQKARERARDAWREGDLDYPWWDAVYEDAARIGALLGIVLDTRSYTTIKGNRYEELDISFSLHGQGSGACCSGELAVARLDGAPARLRREIGDSSAGDQTLHHLADEAQAVYNMIVVRAVTRRLLGIDPDADPDPDQTWGEQAEVGLDDSIPFSGDDRYYRTEVDKSEDYPQGLVEACNDYLQHFVDWLYHQLGDEYDYLTGDDAVDTAIRDNGLLFDAFGSII